MHPPQESVDRFPEEWDDVPIAANPLTCRTHAPERLCRDDLRPGQLRGTNHLQPWRKAESPIARW